MKRLLTSIALLIFLSSFLLAQPVNKAKLDSFFTILAEKNKTMGSVAVSKNGKVLYSRAIGYSLVDEKAPVLATSQTKYRVGSITKMFTTVLIFQLIEEGKLSLGTTLKTFFPEIPNSDKITIEQMLNHHSGIHSFTNDADYMQWMMNPQKPDEIVARIAKSQPEFEPGSKGAYSNSNFYLLGLIVEKITKKPYADVLNNRIVKKIGLRDTRYGSPANIRQNESYSYHWDGKNWVKETETDMSIPHGAGAIVSTPSDLTRFIEALFANKLISAINVEKMKTQKDGFGMGMFSFPFHEKKAFGHNGGIDGFGSMLGYFPQDSLAVAFCTNGQVFGMNDVMIGVLSIYFNRQYELPSFKTLTLTSEELDKYPGAYSSTELPLKITVTREGSILKAQATGQSAFPLDAADKNTFTFQPAGIVMVFTEDGKGFTLKQGGKSFNYTKD